MNIEKLKEEWLKEESIAHIKGWDFSHINDRYDEQEDMPWDYEKTIKKYLKDDMKILDYDTGGGEFLLSLKHPYENTSATEGYPPNVEVCKEILLPLGIDFRECDDAKNLPFDDESFDLYMNRHGDLDPAEANRVLKKNGIFVTQQVGCYNDRDLVDFVLPNTELPFPSMKLDVQRKLFEENGFEIVEGNEFYGTIKFYDVGAFVWFAHIIEWEFPNFSVDNCLDKLIEMQEIIDEKGEFKGTTHRYLLVARKK